MFVVVLVLGVGDPETVRGWFFEEGRLGGFI